MHTAYDHLWNNRLPVRDNVICLLKDYKPHPFNIFSCRTHISEANKMIKVLETEFMEDTGVYTILQLMLVTVEGEEGEFRRRLAYAVEKIAKNNPLLYLAGKLEENVKNYVCDLSNSPARAM